MFFSTSTPTSQSSSPHTAAGSTPLLFLIIFAETGLVVTPILPGDSLLFAAGALAATGSLDIRLVVFLLILAAILGDAVNYAVGKAVGPRIFRSIDRTSWWQRLLNREHLARAHEFFEKYGGKAIILGRFVPIVRTVRSVRRGRGDDDVSDVRTVQRHGCGDLGRDLYSRRLRVRKCTRRARQFFAGRDRNRSGLDDPDRDRVPEAAARAGLTPFCELGRMVRSVVAPKHAVTTCTLGADLPYEWAASSVGRAPRSQRGGREFEPPAVHQSFLTIPSIPTAPHPALRRL